MLAGLLAAATSSCAYYNSFYLAKKYYFRATNGEPYEVDRVGSPQTANYAKTIDYSKKVLGLYPKSKYVDDAWLMWGKALVGRDDPLQTVTMLQEFDTRFPKSDLRPDAEFFLGLAYRNARKYPQAVAAFDNFLAQAPRNPLVPYAHLERAHALMSLKRYGEAADAAGRILDQFPRHLLADKARRQRAEARLQQGDFEGARADFHEIGLRAGSDEERFQFFMREIDALESARKYDDELAALRDELSHTPPPPIATPGQLPPPGSDRFGRITVRIGTAQLLASHTKEALEQFSHVLKDYPKSALSAEAQYRIGYTYETGADDFDRALQEYAKVKDEFGQTPFTQQAQQRSDNLGRIMQYRKGAGADSLEKKAEAGFLTAELYLFQLDKPERALDAYGKVVEQYPGTAVAGRALNAQAWVLSRKLNRKSGADSLFWKVVREYPATEAQLAARDYLEQDGQVVPDSLIVLPTPKPQPALVDTLPALPKPPEQTPPLGAFSHSDSLHFGMPPGGPGNPRFGLSRRDSLLRYNYPGMSRDTTGRPFVAPGTPPPVPPVVPPVPPPATSPPDSTRKSPR